MIVYELTHLFFRYEDELVYSPKNLGLYNSYDSANQAIQYFSSQPGFFENRDAFSVRERNVTGNIVDDIVFEVVVYFHSQKYELEAEIELGLFSDEGTAIGKLEDYCSHNALFVSRKDLIVEKIVNKCVLGKKEWIEGFSVSE